MAQHDLIEVEISEAHVEEVIVCDVHLEQLQPWLIVCNFFPKDLKNLGDFRLRKRL